MIRRYNSIKKRERPVNERITTTKKPGAAVTSAQKGNTTMKIIKIWRIHFPYAGVTFYAFSQNRADSTCDLFVKNYGDPVVDVVLVPVDPYVPVDASLDPSGLVERQDGVVFPYIDSDGVISDPHGYITIWKSRGWNGVAEEVIP